MRLKCSMRYAALDTIVLFFLFFSFFLILARILTRTRTKCVCVCVEAKELKRAEFIGCGRLWTQNTEEEREEEGGGGPFGFMLTAEELNGVFLGPNRIPIVIDDEVRPLLYICGFLLIKQAEWQRIARRGLLAERDRRVTRATRSACVGHVTSWV